jgi:RNA polymerase sigma-70 factor (ECF subfamily)
MYLTTWDKTRDESAGIFQHDESGRAEGIERPKREDFEHVYHFYYRQVFLLCLRMTGNFEEAEDLTQQAFLQIYKKLDTFRGESSFYAWVHRLTVNVVLMRFRKRRLAKENSLEEFRGADSGWSACHSSKVLFSDTTMLLANARVDTNRALDRLPPRFRDVLVLHDLEGYKHMEISALLGCSISASKSQLHRARLRIRKLMRSGRREKSPVQ